KGIVNDKIDATSEQLSDQDLITGREFGVYFFFFSSRRRHTRSDRDWSSDVCSSDLRPVTDAVPDDEHVAGERAQHQEVALSEIHELGRLVDEDEAQSHQTIDAADRQTIQRQLQDNLQNGPPIRASLPGRPGAA